jgi:ADP-ribose pyrophosphatase|tara:strand:+ start:207 stop:776 length:570 start_codon:yes stop_codon:yes gene_type:complete
MDKKDSFIKKLKIEQTERVYQGRLFSFVVEDITLPNDTKTKMAMVRHPGSAAIVPLREDGNVVMIHQYRHPVRDFLLEIPAGTIEPGESPLDCARRELIEETGLKAKEFIKLTEVHILPAYSDEKTHVYLARKFTSRKQRLDQDEILEVVEYPLGEVVDMIGSGVATDALTILSIQMAWMYLQKNDLSP